MKSNFFRILKEKITRKPDRHFDQNFWANFENEFGTKKESLGFSGWKIRLALGSFAILALVMIGTLYQKQQVEVQVAQVIQTEEKENMNEILENEEMLANMELLLEFDENEWDYLLEDKES